MVMCGIIFLKNLGGIDDEEVFPYREIHQRGN